jgi:CRP-like cAMP-binding protein
MCNRAEPSHEDTVPPALNLLIQRLPVRDRKRLLGLCEPVELALSDVLNEAGTSVTHVMFPLDGFVSLITPVPGHPGLEVGMVGHEGMLGIELALGIAVSPVRTLVQGAGQAWRLAREPFDHEVRASPALRQAVYAYIHVQMAQLATASACRRFHLIGPRLARWLLMTQDRSRRDRFRVTHEFLALMLGVRRVGVTVAAGALQEEGLIRYHRGEIDVRDRAGLEARACSCYESDSSVYREHLPRSGDSPAI